MLILSGSVTYLVNADDLVKAMPMLTCIYSVLFQGLRNKLQYLELPVTSHDDLMLSHLDKLRPVNIDHSHYSDEEVTGSF